MRELIGTTLDSYRLENFLAEYRIDCVYEAKDAFGDRRVLLKLARKDTKAAEVLRDETRIMKHRLHFRVHAGCLRFAKRGQSSRKGKLHRASSRHVILDRTREET